MTREPFSQRANETVLPFRLYSSPPQGSAEARLDQDDVHALAPSRVLLGIALGLARAGLVPDAAKELVKAAAVRPRWVVARWFCLCAYRMCLDVTDVGTCLITEALLEPVVERLHLVMWRGEKQLKTALCEDILGSSR